MSTIRVGLVGLGHVGRAVARLFDRNAASFSRRLGVGVRLAWVCDRHPAAKLRGIALKDRPRVTRRFEAVLADPAVEVVIELIGGRREARRLVLGALAAGKRVITANKQLLAHEWQAVFAAAARHRTAVAFEASVAGAVPVLQALRTGLAANDISHLTGILNGTTNFILSRMDERGWDFARALREAQACGMAERDPAQDLDGTDTVHKIAILASLLAGAWVRPESVYREGITAVGPEDLAFARRQLGRTVRLLGILDLDRSRRPLRLEARVHPALVPLDHPLAAVHGGYNAVMVQASAARDLLFYGLGAGPEPAASAVLSDLFATVQDLAAGAARPDAAAGGRVELRPAGAVASEFYLRLQARDRPGVLARVSGALARQGISIASIHQEAGGRGPVSGVRARAPHPAPRAPSGVPIFITTHPAAWSAMRRALHAIRGLGAVDRKATCLRFL